jgi:hypothetical protein
VLVAIAFFVMVFVVVWWMRLEDRKLRDQAERIRSSSMTVGGV